MNTDDFAGRLRALELFREQRLLPATWLIVRVDGRRFTSFTAERFEKPFDTRFHMLMVRTTAALTEELQGVFAFTSSDEISIVLPPHWDLFNRRHEKLISLSAAISSGTFSLACGEVAHFDSRVWLGPTLDHVVDYLRWRQADASRCALNGWAYWTLRHEGMTATQASDMLKGQDVSFKNELLFQRGINFTDVPAWQRRGTALYHEHYLKQGFDPVQATHVEVERRRLKLDEALPIKDAFATLIRTTLHDVKR